MSTTNFQQILLHDFKDIPRRIAAREYNKYYFVFLSLISIAIISNVIIDVTDNVWSRSLSILFIVCLFAVLMRYRWKLNSNKASLYEVEIEPLFKHRFNLYPHDIRHKLALSLIQHSDNSTDRVTIDQLSDLKTAFWNYHQTAMQCCEDMRDSYCKGNDSVNLSKLKSDILKTSKDINIPRGPSRNSIHRMHKEYATAFNTLLKSKDPHIQKLMRDTPAMTLRLQA